MKLSRMPLAIFPVPSEVVGKLSEPGRRRISFRNFCFLSIIAENILVKTEVSKIQVSGSHDMSFCSYGKF